MVAKGYFKTFVNDQYPHDMSKDSMKKAKTIKDCIFFNFEHLMGYPVSKALMDSFKKANTTDMNDTLAWIMTLGDFNMPDPTVLKLMRGSLGAESDTQVVG